MRQKKKVRLDLERLLRCQSFQAIFMVVHKGTTTRKRDAKSVVVAVWCGVIFAAVSCASNRQCASVDSTINKSRLFIFVAIIMVNGHCIRQKNYRIVQSPTDERRPNLIFLIRADPESLERLKFPLRAHTPLCAPSLSRACALVAVWKPQPPSTSLPTTLLSSHAQETRRRR